MITRLKIDGFKNLVDVDLRLGPFTCIAGPNGSGKSNLFDAIQFLSALADQPLLEAALSVRSEAGRNTDPRRLFHRMGDGHRDTMTFEVEMLVSPNAVDDLGQEARAAITFLTYGLELCWTSQGLEIGREDLSYIKVTEAISHLLFPHSSDWRKSVVFGRRTEPLISTDLAAEKPIIQLHVDYGDAFAGRPRSYVASRLPRTVLSNVNAAENATAVIAKREMQSWRLLQLEPSALRAPDEYSAPSSLSAGGAHLPATLARLGKREPGSRNSPAVFTRIANRLAELIEGARSLRLDADDRRELLTLMLTETNGTEHEARALSDGTLRFLALAILEEDPEALGVLCLEEPENGIHPERVPAMVDLLSAIAVDPREPVGEDNPLRQVLINTHSSAVVGQIPEDDLVMVVAEQRCFDGQFVSCPAFRALPGTWRTQGTEAKSAVAPGRVISLLTAANQNPDEGASPKERRVRDRPDIRPFVQLDLPLDK